MKAEFTSIIIPLKDGGYKAVCREIPGISGTGETIGQAKQNLQQSLVSAFDEHYKLIHQISAKNTVTENINVDISGMRPAETDPIKKFFERPFFLTTTIGIPFCVFKLLFGMMAAKETSGGSFWIPLLGWIIIVWAVIDFLMNTGRSLFDLFRKHAKFEYCIIAQLGKSAGTPAVFLAIDTLLTFSIICAMLWTRWITHLTPLELSMWYGATTLNLISLSIVSLYNEILQSQE